MTRLLYNLFIVFVNFLLVVLPTSFFRACLLRLCGARISNSTFIASKVRVEFPWRLCIGKNCYISRNVYFDCRGGDITIGSNSDISEGAKIYTLTHNIDSLDFSVKKRDVVIGSRVWVCAMAVVLPGSVLKDGIVLGACSVFNGNSSANSLYRGNPAILVKVLPKNRAINVRFK